MWKEEGSNRSNHAGWTWLIGEVYIPDLPFTDWEGQNQDNISLYTVFIESRDSAKFHAYAKSLADFGYKLEQTESYYYSGTDPEGRKTSLSDPGNGFMEINIFYNSN